MDLDDRALGATDGAVWVKAESARIRSLAMSTCGAAVRLRRESVALRAASAAVPERAGPWRVATWWHRVPADAA